MKKLYFILCFQLVLLASVFAQMVPKGINYQAVARNLKGEIIPNQKLSLKIYLFGNEDQLRTNHFSEIHEVTTNELGLFTLVIGEGSSPDGQYGLIPWNQENIWMEVAMKEKGQSGFASVNSSRLLAVPYAIHAGTATRLASTSTTQTSNFAPPEPGVVSNTWSVFGNANTDSSGNLYHTNALGTTDKVDLFLITDNVERLRILSGGNIVTKLNFEVGKNLKVGGTTNVGMNATIDDSLTVKKNVFLNTVSGQTINFGPFNVINMSPTLLSGTLQVDSATDLNHRLNVDGPTDLNDSLSVNNMSPTKLTGTLQVDSTTTLNDALFVNNASPTKLTGTLTVDSAATFKHKVLILSQFSTDTSGLTPTGSLQVGGGAYIKENLYIGGVAKFGGPVAFGGAVTIQDVTQSISPTTGALKVIGGVGIGLNLNVGGAATFGLMTTVKDITESTNTATGALKVFGGMGIKKRLNVGGSGGFSSTLTVRNITSMFDSLNVTSSNSHIAFFKNETNQNGISIEVNNTAPGWANNFVEFRNSSAGVVGRIEGENVNEYKNNPAYIFELAKLNGSIVSASIALSIAAIVAGLATAALVGAISSATICAGFGVCVAAPVISLIVKAVLDVAAGVINVVATAVGVAAAVGTKNDFINYKATRYGVTYESGAGDYAEWLPKANPAEAFLPGYIVGLQNGKITKNTNEGGRLLVISTQPIVLGNMPENNKELPYEKVAFLGQVPVHVLGKVNTGDYIVPSGSNDGLGRAVSPAKMKVEDYSKIVGVAWSASKNEAHNLINVAIGLNGSDISRVVVEQKNRIQGLVSKFDQRNMILGKLVPGFKEAAGLKDNPWSGEAFTTENVQSLRDLKTIAAKTDDYNYFEFDQDQLSDLLDKAEKMVTDQGGTIDANSFWSKMKSDPVLKENFLKDLKMNIRKELPGQVELIKSRANATKE